MIPLFNLSIQYKKIKKRIDVKLENSLSSGIYILGDEVRNFEKEFARYLGIKYAVGVACGTDALKISLKALGLNSKDEVILPANVYPTAFGVAESGVKIKLVDIDKNTYNLNQSLLEKVITKKTKAIVVVHLYGQPCQMDKVFQIAKKCKLLIIEDCAQAHGAEYKGKKVGTIGDIGCFSFYPTKPLGAFGDGGMIVTNNLEIYEKILMLRMYGEQKRYDSQILGYNSRLDELQAAILRVKLKYLDKWNQERIDKALIYRKNLLLIPEIKLPQDIEAVKNVYHLFVIRVQKRNSLQKFLKKKGILTGIHYPIPIHLVKSFRYLGYKKGDFLNSEKLSLEILSLPLYSGIKNEEILMVVKEIKKFYEKEA